MKAVEDRDIMFLMEVRDKAFPVSSHAFNLMAIELIPI